MAIRPVYSTSNGKVIKNEYEFQWFAGFSLAQKQRSIVALHNAVKTANKKATPLEISTKGIIDLGVKLSAFNLKLNGYTLENIFQSSKVFSNGGPYRDLLDVSPKESKRDDRLYISGALLGFNYSGIDFPLEPKTVFYDYIYINAVKQTLLPEEIEKIKGYTHFTDIEFNPQRSINTQAKSVAIIRLMLELYNEIPSFDVSDFIRFHSEVVKC
ncbi:hypothetical protein SAMN02910265_01010 [Ruminococcus flavefaciens]|uniref:Uncharacterized protein n=1 Tax=Ruminococcus flavefaciens TaxID=1265 RepID=A0A1H6IJF7_RUMFL|nr:hypothetical protein [Ruminococcus flavefaciens]SEH48734.1 hypothetical protein SAMN02910265_01010 [Ruminococcus flavefaciens]